MGGEVLRERKPCCKEAYFTGARMVAELVRRHWKVPSDGSGPSLDDWLKAIEEWAATAGLSVPLSPFPVEVGAFDVANHLRAALPTLFPDLLYCEMRRHAGDSGKFWLHFESKAAGQWAPAMMVRVEFWDVEFLGMGRQAAIALVKARVLDFTGSQVGEAVFDA